MKPKYLLIVESSSKCASIEKYLGPEYKCIASNGHIRVLADGLKSIDTKNNFLPFFSIDPEKKAHVQKMSGIIDQFKKGSVIIATDNDREGEAIGWHICQVFDLPVETTRRIIFCEITKPALISAIANPKTLDMNLVNAAVARQVLDVLVGFKVSPILWKYVAHGSGLSAGRCQTPALRLVYDRESMDQMNTKIINKIQGCFFPPHNIIINLDYEFQDGESAMVDFLQKSATFKHTFELDKPRISERSPPKPLNTSAILQLASSMLRMGAKETMSCCQTLYQLGHITYMRTDNRTYSPEFIATAQKYIVNNWSDRHLNPVMPVNTNASNPHEAIRVTNIQLDNLIIIDETSKKSNNIERLYKLIWTNTVESCMAPAQYNVLPIVVHAPLTKVYKGTLETPIFLGYQCLKPNVGNNVHLANSNNNTINALILKMQSSKSREAAFNYIQSVPTMEKAKPHYTEASLINHLEELGIGRPSTYSTIIDTIQTRKYVEKTDVPGTKIPCNIYTLRQYELEPSVETVDKTFGAEHGKLVLEPVGKLVVEFLLNKFEALFSYDFTRIMEESLDQVAIGEKPWYQVCDECNKQINKLVNAVAKLEKKVYKLDEDWILLFSGSKGSGTEAKLVNQKTKEFRTIKYGIKLDIEKLERGEYVLDDLAQIDKRELGNGITLRYGKYGLYAEHDNGTTVSLSHLKKSIEQVEQCDVHIPESGLNAVTSNASKSVLRTLTPELSIRNGKYGPYIFYQTAKMKKPKFFDMKGFDKGFGVCDADELIEWICKKHKIKQ